MRFLNHLDFNKNKGIQAVLDNGSTLPTTPVEGQIFLHTPTGRKHKMLYMDGAWVPEQSYGASTLYVNGASGADTPDKGTGTGSAAFASVAYAVSRIPRILGGNVTINIASGTYREQVTINGKFYSGDYEINLIGATSDSVAATSLNSAANPADAVFGRSTAGATFTAQPIDRKTVIKATSVPAGYVTKLRVHCRNPAGGGNQVMVGVLYSDSSGPANLLGTSFEATVVDSTAAGWVDLIFPQAIKIAAGTYWLGVHTGGTTNQIEIAHDTGTSGDTKFNADTYSDGPTSTFGAATDDNKSYSIEGTVLASGEAGYGTLTKTGAGWTVNAYRDKWVEITSGTGSGQIYPIHGNTATVLTIVGRWSAIPDGNFRIFDVATRITGSNAGADTTPVRNFAILMNQGQRSINFKYLRLDYTVEADISVSDGAALKKLEYCELSNGAGYGLYLEQLAQAGTITGCVVKNNLYSIVGVSGAQILLIQNNRITCVTDYALGLYFIGGSVLTAAFNFVNLSGVGTYQLYLLQTSRFITDAYSEYVGSTSAPSGDIIFSSGNSVLLVGGSYGAANTQVLRDAGGYGLISYSGALGQGASGLLYSGNTNGSYFPSIMTDGGND